MMAHSPSVHNTTLKKGAKLVYKTFAKFGLQMHIGTTEKASKTECVFFPAPGHFNPPALPQSSTDVQLTPVTTQPTKENAEQKQKRQYALYDGASVTTPIKIGDLGIITFTRNFKYLGGYCSYSLKDDYDVDERLSQASSVMGALNHFWSDRAVDDHSKYQIFRAIPCNLLLWGCESWALREATLKKLEVFLHCNIQKILGITITQVIDKGITNKSVRTILFSIPTIRNQIAQRKLTFIGKVLHNKDYQIPTQLLTAWCDNKRQCGGVLQNNKKNLAKNIRLIILGAAKHGLLTLWVYFALDAAYWKYLILQLWRKKTEWTGNEPNPHSTPPPVLPADGLMLRPLAPRLVTNLRPPPPPLVITTDCLRRLRRLLRTARTCRALLEMEVMKIMSF